MIWMGTFLKPPEKHFNVFWIGVKMSSAKVACRYCGREYTKRGISRHEKACKMRTGAPLQAGRKGTSARATQGAIGNADALLRSSSIIAGILDRLQSLEVQVRRLSNLIVGMGPAPEVDQGAFDEQVLQIYRQVRRRKGQAVQLSTIWEVFQANRPDVPLEKFKDLLLNSDSSEYHLSSGSGELQVRDPATGKSYGYLVAK
ncbi:MAG: hypothetical protein Kow0069_38310 [Promethearchaeota archaeon]